MEKQDKVEKTTQKILNRLISEETVAVGLYDGALNNVKPEQYAAIAKKFKEIRDDEANDHLASLQKFACQNGFEVPFTFKDIERHSSKKMFSCFEGLKKGQDAKYYIGKAIESEHEAIKSFEEAMAEDYMFELQGILLRCYYDEIQHLQELELLLQCVDMGVYLES